MRCLHVAGQEARPVCLCLCTAAKATLMKACIKCTTLTIFKGEFIFSIFKEFIFLISSFQIVKTIHFQEIK